MYNPVSLTHSCQRPPFSSFLFLILVWFMLYANSNAMSLCAKVPPYLPDFEIIPLAFVFSIHRFAVRLKLFNHACFLNTSNSMGLKCELFMRSQIPKNSMVVLLLSQF